jgi:hypothetical protein
MISAYNHYRRDPAILSFKQDSAPSIAVVGDLWADTSVYPVTFKTLISTGPNVWAALGSLGGNTQITYSTTAPVAPAVGQLWLDIS